MLKTYKVTFQRENGTTGEDKFTASNEAEALRDFREVYRHGNGKVLSVEEVTERDTSEAQAQIIEKMIELGLTAQEVLILLPALRNLIFRNLRISTELDDKLEDALLPSLLEGLRP